MAEGTPPRKKVPSAGSGNQGLSVKDPAPKDGKQKDKAASPGPAPYESAPREKVGPDSDREVLSPDTTPDELPRPKEYAEAGVSLHLPFVSQYKDMWEVFRDDPVSVQQLVAMRRTDGQSRALYRLITMPIRAALKQATFTPAEGGEGGEEEAEFCEAMLTTPPQVGGMKTSFTSVIAEMLMAVFDGFAAHEISYQVPTKGPLEGKIIPWKIAHRPAETLTFLVDDAGEFGGFRQRVSFRGEMRDVTIPKEHSFYYAANEEERPFYGVSYFQSAFYHWDKKVKLYYIAHLAAQRAAVGTRVGKLNANPTPKDKQTFKKALADLGVATHMMIPFDYEVESLKEGGTFDFLNMINHHNSQMSKSVLAQFFDDDSGKGSNDRTMVDFGQESDAMFLLMLQSVMDDIAAVVNNHLIPRFVDWNFGSGKYPRFRFGPLTTEQRRAIRETFDKLSVAGQTMLSTPEFLFELEKILADEFGLEIDYDAVEQRIADEAAIAEEQQAALLDATLNPPMPPGGAAAAGKPAGGGSTTTGAKKPGDKAAAAPQPILPKPPKVVKPVKAPSPKDIKVKTSTSDTGPIVSLSELARELLVEAAALGRELSTEDDGEE